MAIDALISKQTSILKEIEDLGSYGETVEFHKQILDCLKRLQWYESQNLIRREDVKELFRCDGMYECLGYNCLEILQPVDRKRIKPEKLKYCEDCYKFKVFNNRLGLIPKAEPKEDE